MPVPAPGPQRLTGAIRLPGGGWIRGRGLARPLPGGITPQYGLYLGMAGLRRRHDHGLAWPHDWLAWPEFRLPVDEADAIARIRALRERARAGELVEVACRAGIGRTGTVIACLAVLDGLAPVDAIRWTRANLHPRAVETPWQRRWVGRWAARFPAR